mmetsp:Transcript_78670/g.197658  ORF Transcript_78670/g.197658 Transcript_78670/m.197658 type:complete len:211 (+) Transcript_78670:1421-2053(+)
MPLLRGAMLFVAPVEGVESCRCFFGDPPAVIRTLRCEVFRLGNTSVLAHLVPVEAGLVPFPSRPPVRLRLGRLGVPSLCLRASVQRPLPCPCKCPLCTADVIAALFPREAELAVHVVARGAHLVEDGFPARQDSVDLAAMLLAIASHPLGLQVFLVQRGLARLLVSDLHGHALSACRRPRSRPCRGHYRSRHDQTSPRAAPTWCCCRPPF